jgi:hypothetical protein
LKSARQTGKPDIAWMTFAFVFNALCLLVLCSLPNLSNVSWIPAIVIDGRLREYLLNVGLAACLVLAAAVFAGSFGRLNRLGRHPLAPFVLIFFSAAIFHNLSVRFFRWTYDNNPLLITAFFFLLGPLLANARRGTGEFPGWPAATRALIYCCCTLVMWCAGDRQLKLAAACTETWPEIRQLVGARLRPEASGMRRLVQVVRSQTGPRKHDAVLLLPNDPNVEAWFERDRPALSTAIIFADQYWDRYVDGDFAKLRADPPRVIVIGPRDRWRRFGRVWKTNRGVERLIDLVQNELLPESYGPGAPQPISIGGATDYMDVYVRRETPRSDAP